MYLLSFFRTKYFIRIVCKKYLREHTGKTLFQRKDCYQCRYWGQRKTLSYRSTQRLLITKINILLTIIDALMHLMCCFYCERIVLYFYNNFSNLSLRSISFFRDILKNYEFSSGVPPVKKLRQLPLLILFLFISFYIQFSIKKLFNLLLYA